MLNRVRLFATTWTVACQVPSIYGISQASILDWGAISKSRGSSQPRLQTHVSCFGRQNFFLTTEPPGKPLPEDQFSSVAQSGMTLCDPMDCSTPGFLVPDQLPKPAQIHAHQVSDAIQPSHPVTPFSSCLQSCPASGSFPMSQFFTSGGQSIEASALASVLPMNIQGCFPLGLTGLISLQSKGLSRVFSSTTVQKHQFFSSQLSLWFNSHIRT